MLKHIAIILTVVPLLGSGLQAQSPGEGLTASMATESLTMVCATSDGMVTITDRLVTLADYQLKFDGFISDGVVRFTDPDRNTVAVLDARGDEGLYLEIQEDETRMLVVAARSDISYRFSNDGNEPAAPAWSSVVNHLRNNGATPR